MASGRVGGTKSKKSGQVGTNIYQIRKNTDGSYSQIVMIKPESKQETLTYDKAKQRMFMSVIMRHMSLLTDFMNAFNEETPDGTLSVQEFVRSNLKWIKEYAELDNPFNWLAWWPTYGEEEALPASLIISDGDKPSYVLDDYTTGGTSEGWSNTIEFHYVSPNQTWREWLEEADFDIGLYGVIIHFCMATDGQPARYLYQRFGLRSDIDLDSVITRSTFRDAWVQKGVLNYQIWNMRLDSQGGFYPRLTSDTTLSMKGRKGAGSFTCGKKDGKKYRSRCVLRISSGWSYNNVRRLTFQEAMDSWYTERM